MWGCVVDQNIEMTIFLRHSMVPYVRHFSLIS